MPGIIKWELSKVREEIRKIEDELDYLEKQFEYENWDEDWLRSNLALFKQHANHLRKTMPYYKRKFEAFRRSIFFAKCDS